MNTIIFGAPMKYGADKNGLDKSIESLVKFNSDLSNEVRAVDVKYVKEDIICDKLKHLNTIVNYCDKLAKIIYTASSKNEFPLVIGGDHSVSIGSVSGVSKGKDIGLLWIDAHGDFNTDRTTHSGHIHGMPLAAISGLGNKKLVNCLYDGAKVKEKNIAYLGTRDLDDEESELIKQRKILNISSRDIFNDGFESCVSKALNHFSKNIEGIHISLDLDVLDPKICPGVSVPAPNGLTYEQLVGILNLLFDTGKVISMDIVEYNPKFDCDNKTIIILNKLISLVKERVK